MASSTSKLAFRIVLAALILLALFYVCRPLYWKISATVHDIRHNKQTDVEHEALKDMLSINPSQDVESEALKEMLFVKLLFV
ncbi:hypothetical protein GOBAR_AA03941 [Gossypium barbadense]|uniref:Uncharacterized protein n=1 Tax=Gossypium barbadense TaxID=3634 RepID=A0A2P5YM27_GOSBA|nr:hypothetical protein GOBAR_AA03941 [Gossypium barbadense]